VSTSYRGEIMGKKLNDDEIKFEARKQKARTRLGPHKTCAVCGEGDWRCLELHHIAGRAFDEMTVALCRNCHRKQSDPSSNERASTEPAMMEQIGHFLLGLAELLLALAGRLAEFGRSLIEGASSCPSPWGTHLQENE
jgi:hypothetical protein